jgi:hypothetical protein|tara:strand:- start:1057 stop:1233 length:177 start_codon:yes stop_codon:yes gene_type:complete
MKNSDKITLFQSAGELIIDKYKNYNDIPDNYKYFYNIYIPPSCGKKRKLNNYTSDENE